MTAVTVSGKKWLDGGLELFCELSPCGRWLSHWRDRGCTCDEVHDGYGQCCCECDQSPEAVFQHMVHFLSEVRVSNQLNRAGFRILAWCFTVCLPIADAWDHGGR